jgi:hypothetical protein
LTPTIEVEELAAGDTSPERLVRFVDTTIEGGRSVWYRVVAEDSEGNRSLPSDALATRFPKREPPSPPTWVTTEPAPGGGVELTWSAAEDDLEPLVLRRQPGDPLWAPRGPWLPRGTTSFLVADAAAGTTYQYRLQVRDRVGHLVEGPVQTVINPA